MKRRDFIALGAVSALGTSLASAAWAQQPGGRKRIGYLNPNAPPADGGNPTLDAVRAGLKEEGFIEGTNVIIDARYGNSDPALIRAAAHELAGGGYDVLIGSATVATAALVAETKTTPIVFLQASDPIGSGFVQSFARPGGNVTGFTNYEASLGGKWLETLHQVAPGVRRAVMIFNPDTSLARFFVPAFRVAAAALGIEPSVVEVRTIAEIEAAIADVGRAPGGGVVMGSDTYIANGAAQRTFIDAVARENLPAVYPFLASAEAGGLVSYGVDLTDINRRGGDYAGLILKGARPADLPVQAPAKFALTVNLKTAKAQGITIPPFLVTLADKVIE